MPRPSPLNSKRLNRKSSAAPRASTHSPQAPLRYEPVDPAWIIKALAAMLALALLCAYFTLCLIFSRTQWQIVLHPSRTVAVTPAALGLAFTPVHFDVDAAGQPQLDGWFLPASPPADSPTQTTALLLHGGDGSMADALPQAQLLHNAHLNVLLFDYRGFGRSAGRHPTQALMQSDAGSAYTYLTSTRNLAPSSLVVFGEGLGASIAVHLCAQHPQIPVLILESPDGDLESRVRADTRSHLLPLSLFFHNAFPLAAPLRTLATPKLLLTFAKPALPDDLRNAANPKMTVEIPSPADTAALQQALRRFLDSYGPVPYRHPEPSS